MPKHSSPSEVGSNEAGPVAQNVEGLTATKPSKTGTGRFHVVRGISYPVVRSYYDRLQDVVFDVIEVSKSIPRKNGVLRSATIHRHVRCADQAIQDKYCMKRSTADIQPAVTIDVE